MIPEFYFYGTGKFPSYAFLAGPFFQMGFLAGFLGCPLFYNNETGAQTIVDDLKPRWEKRFNDVEENEEQNPAETSPAISDSTAGDQ